MVSCGRVIIINFLPFTLLSSSIVKDGASSPTAENSLILSKIALLLRHDCIYDDQ